MEQGPLSPLLVREVTRLAQDIFAFELRATDGGELPAFTAARI